MFRHHRSSAPWFSPQRLPDLVPNIGVLTTLAGLVMSLLLAVLPANPDTEDPGDPATGYEQPAPEVQEDLERIRGEIFGAVLELRLNEGAPPVIMGPHLQLAAQRQAERSAVAGSQQRSPNNVTMIQHHLPQDAASGYAFLDAWLHSEAHTAPLLDARYTFTGIGVAVGHGQVWVAVQLSAE